MKCFFHKNDLDGKSSGALIRRAHGNECKMVGLDYGDDFPWGTLSRNERVYVVDFCLQPFTDMERLDGLVELVWIDHHETAIAEAGKRNFRPQGVRRVGVGACELVWRYLNGAGSIPRWVRYLSRYDVWDLRDVNVRMFQYGMRCYPNGPENKVWDDLLGPDSDIHVNNLISQGKMALRYRKQFDAQYVGAFGFPVEFEGLKAICVNRGIVNSDAFGSVRNLKDKYDLMMAFVRRPNRLWTVYLYSVKPEIDVGKIAKKHGGGGHSGAAGFQAEQLPFEI